EFGSFPEIKDAQALLAKWQRIREIRSDITKAIELQREAGIIGSSLQAELLIQVSAADFEMLQSILPDLRFVTITSKAEIAKSSDGNIQITVKPSVYQKCARCWHHSADVGSDPNHPDLCGRCISNLGGAGELRQYA
ncbi:MAG: isoleucine--tRNA ligase, partial [Burkholderiaceae bacterium]|nr:isoleucine--tRNA ligase [Burkholderiaceae bacterium]